MKLLVLNRTPCLKETVSANSHIMPHALVLENLQAVRCVPLTVPTSVRSQLRLCVVIQTLRLSSGEPLRRQQCQYARCIVKPESVVFS